MGPLAFPFRRCSRHLILLCWVLTSLVTVVIWLILVPNAVSVLTNYAVGCCAVNLSLMLVVFESLAIASSAAETPTGHISSIIEFDIVLRQMPFRTLASIAYVILLWHCK